MRGIRAVRAFGVTLAVALVRITPAAAQEAVDVEDVNLETLLDRDLDEQLGTTNAVSRKQENVLTAPAAMSTLTADEIAHSGARTIPDLLRWIPGVQVYRNAPGNYVVSVRGTGGLNGNNVVVTINGVPLNRPLDASIDWDLIPIHVADIERIEVVRGPVSTIYGANAYTGVINIVTREAYAHSHSMAARVEVGADSDAETLGATSGRYASNSKHLRASIFAGSETDRTGRAGNPDTPSERRGSAFVHGEWLPNERNRLVLDLGVSRSHRSSLDHLVQESNPELRSMVVSSLRFDAQDATSKIASFSLWARNTAQFSETNASAYRGFSYAETRSSRAAFGTDVGFGLSPNALLTLGAEADLDWIDAPYVNPAANDTIYPGYGFHAGLNYTPISNLHLTLGGRGDVPSATGDLKFSYRASAVYDATNWALRLAAASAYRAPSYVELGGRFVDASSGLILLEGDPTVRPPTNDTVELGLIAAPARTFHVLPTLYVSRLRDVIVEDFEPLVRKTFRNDEDPRYLFGTELEAEWQARDDLALAANFGTLHWLDVNESVTATVGVPEQSSTLVLGMRIHGSLANERVGYGFGANYASERSFAVRAGVPPRILDEVVPASTHGFGMAEYSLGTSMPLWLSLRVFAPLPASERQSPLPAAAGNATIAVLGLSYREE